MGGQPNPGSIIGGPYVELLRWDRNRIEDCIWIIRSVGMQWRFSVVWIGTCRVF